MIILKTIKKYAWIILIIVALLYVQARCDLALPSYLSDITNVGVAQRGITDCSIKQIRTSEMSKLMVFMSEDDRQIIQDSYTIDGEVMLLNSTDTAAISQILKKPMAIAYSISSSELQAEMLMRMQQQLGIQFPDGANIYEIIANMPSELSNQVVAGIQSAVESYIDDAMMQSIAIEYMLGEYEANGYDLSHQQNRYILIAGLKMLAFTLLTVTAVVCVCFLSVRVSAYFSRDLRQKIFRKVLTFSGNELGEFSSASLITRCTNDIQQIQMMLQMTLRMVLYAPILGIGALIKIQGTNLMWVIGLSIGCMLILITVLMIVALPRFTALQKLTDRINLITREIITGLPVIRAFSRSDHEEKRFEEANKAHAKTQLFVVRVMSMMMPIMAFIMNTTSLLIVWVGASAIDKAAIQVGDLVSFTQYAMMIIMSFLMLSMISIQMPRAMISVKRISEVLNKEPIITTPAVPVALDTFKKGSVEFRNVSFKFAGAEEYALRNISFTASAGETIAIIGSTGSGKTTLVSLIPRFYDVTEGEVVVCGTDVRKASLSDLRSKIGYVPQKAFLFSGTIESNIAFALDNYEMAQVTDAAEVSQSAGFIGELENGYQNAVSQGGTNVSGGQRQRLSIARAIAKNPEIYIFDDSFSALDFKTDIELRRALNSTTADSTKIIVAQRISTVMNADKILVLEDGALVGMGSHKELMQSCDVYRDIALSQLSEKEVG